MNVSGRGGFALLFPTIKADPEAIFWHPLRNGRVAVEGNE